MKKFFLTQALILLLIMQAVAQWECPSQLAANLNQVGESKLYWSSELTLGGGYLQNNWIGNGMGIIGLDRSTDKSTFYAEGGIKYWNRYDISASNDYDNSHLGLRELYYQYKGIPGSLTLGVQSTRLDDDFLMNERILGTNLKLTEGKWSLNVVAGSVTKDFARNGTFCNVGYIYDIFPERERAILGNTIGQTNLASFSIKFKPQKLTSKASKTSDGEFSTNEFSEGLGQESTKKVDKLKIESLGAIAYHEFGSWIPQKFITSGLFAQVEWGKNWMLKPEVLFQAATENKAIIYSLKIEKLLAWENSKTSINFRYLGKTNLDDNARVLNSFSNIFAGDIIRLDAIDLPFIQAGIKHSFPKSKIHFKSQFSSQLNGDSMKELDFEIGKKVGKNLQINVISGVLRSNLLSEDAFMGRIEFRYYF
jgi:hypothetical protein